MSSPGALAGRRVLVTGASAGIGRAVAVACAAEGAHLACLARGRAALEEVAGEVGGLPVVADVRERSAVEGAVSAAVDGLGGLDAVVNSAGVYRPGGVEHTDLDGWREMFDSNVLGTLVVTKAALPALERSPSADVVNLSSLGGRRVARVESGVYSGTKFAVQAISESMRREFFDKGIRVAVVAPGAVRSGFGLDSDDDEQVARIAQRRSRIGLEPAAVARQVVRILAEPRDVTVYEIMLASTRQPPG
jgi:NADP-dependent 3-hydroxy acid dehydrogenase YdfG